MSTSRRDVFVQVGATRDGLDPYLAVARGRGLTSFLVETPTYLDWRRRRGRAQFDAELAVEDPSDPRAVAAVLEALRSSIALVLPGFERYAAGAYAAAAALGVRPQAGGPASTFDIPDKAVQRQVLARLCPAVLQPRHASFALGDRAARGSAGSMDDLRYPLVVKPSDGGGGLGVFIVNDAEARARAVAQIERMSNYGGGDFGRIMVEEFVEGTEHSLQGVAWRGRASLLTTCEKIILRERSAAGELVGTREAVHIASPAGQASAELREMAQRCVEATGYRDGPFHIDLIQNSVGCYFVEMGFRLSGGGVVALVRRASGLDWADVAFRACLEEDEPPPHRPPSGVVGQATLACEVEMEIAAALGREGVRLELQRFASPASVDGAEPEHASMTSDRLRHGGFAGRVIVEAERVEEARAHLRRCVAPRVEN